MKHYTLDITGHSTVQPSREEIVKTLGDVMDRKIEESDDPLLKEATGFKVEVFEISREEPEINWGYNCLTAGIHHGRPEAIWNLPLNYAIGLFSKNQLALLVLTRIHRDALQITLHNSEYDTAWANRVRAHAEEHYDRTLQHKVGELSTYYKSPGFKSDIDTAVDLFARDALNRGFEPLHSHDSINMLCRILGVSSSLKASEG